MQDDYTLNPRRWGWHRALAKICWRGLIIAVVVLHGHLPAAAEWSEPEKIAQVEMGERPSANVLWWGFDPEDATRYLQAAIDSGVAELTIPYTGKDWVVRPITLTQDNQTLFFEDRVVVRAKYGSIRNRGTRLFQAIGRTGLSLIGYGATLRMSVAEFEERGLQRGGDLICLLGCADVLIEGLTLIEGFNDGIYIGRGAGVDYSRNITVRDVVADGNRRQGLSAVSVDGLLVERSVFRNTGGAAPGAGILVEPNRPDDRAANVVVRDSVFENNRRGIHFWLSNLNRESVPVSMQWEDNVVDGNPYGIHVGPLPDDGPRGKVTFHRHTVKNATRSGIHFRNKSSQSVRFVFTETVLRDVALQSGRPALGARTPAPITLHARTERSRVPGGIVFNDVRIEGDDPQLEAEQPLVWIGAIHADWDIVWTNISGRLTADWAGGREVREWRATTDHVKFEVVDGPDH